MTGQWQKLQQKHAYGRRMRKIAHSYPSTQLNTFWVIWVVAALKAGCFKATILAHNIGQNGIHVLAQNVAGKIQVFIFSCRKTWHMRRRQCLESAVPPTNLKHVSTSEVCMLFSVSLAAIWRFSADTSCLSSRNIYLPVGGWWRTHSKKSEIWANAQIVGAMFVWRKRTNISWKQDILANTQIVGPMHFCENVQTSVRISLTYLVIFETREHKGLLDFRTGPDSNLLTIGLSWSIWWLTLKIIFAKEEFDTSASDPGLSSSTNCVLATCWHIQ